MDSERAEYEMEVLPLRSVTALRRHLSRRLSCEQDVNDIAQEACLRLLQAHRNKANIQNPNAYLYRIAGNLLYHHYAGQAKRDVANTVDNLADDSSCPEEQTTRAMLRITLGISEARAVFDAARETSACLERRLAPENRGEGVPSRGLDGGNLSEVLGAVFDRHPLELNVALANEVDLAAAQWLRRDYQKGGSRFEAHERAVSDAWARRDENTLCRLMEAAGHPQLMEVDEFLELVAAESPNGRIATPEDVANLVVFLASDLAAQINGASIAVDGGLSA